MMKEAAIKTECLTKTLKIMLRTISVRARFLNAGVASTFVVIVMYPIAG